MRVGLLQKTFFIHLLVSVAGCTPAAAGSTVGIYKLDDQRLTGETSLVSNEPSFSDLTIIVTIDPTGKVIAARATDNFEGLDPAPALALVRTWRFKPQTFEGKPVNAVGRVRVEYKMRPIPPDLSKPFPSSSPADSITLERGACFGTCPDYRVTIHADGVVEFDTGNGHDAGTDAQVHLAYNGHNVLLPGRHLARVDPGKVRALFDRFRAAHFFGLKDEYAAGVTDNPTQRLSVRVGGKTKVVTDYVGLMAGMPNEVNELEDAVDELADTARWVGGNANTLSDLDAVHFNYHSAEGERLALAVAAKMDGYRPPAQAESLILGLIDRGVPLDGPAHVGDALTKVASSLGLEATFTKLAEKGVLAKLPHASLSAAFLSVGCSANIARALVKAGADPHSVESSGTGLTALRGGASTCADHPEKMIDLARTLIELGVPLEARDSLGWTALMGCDSPELAALLLSHGADVKVRDKDGTTAVLSTDDDRVALILLRAGADPRAHDERGTVRSNAVKGSWPATLAWLDEHGVR